MEIATYHPEKSSPHMEPPRHFFSCTGISLLVNNTDHRPFTIGLQRSLVGAAKSIIKRIDARTKNKKETKEKNFALVTNHVQGKCDHDSDRQFWIPQPSEWDVAKMERKEPHQGCCSFEVSLTLSGRCFLAPDFHRLARVLAASNQTHINLSIKLPNTLYYMNN